MSTNIPCKIRNGILFLKCKEFFQKALVPLRPICGREIVEFIQSRPVESRNYYYRLLNPDICFYPLLFRNREPLKQIPEFQQCDTIMHNDPIISRHLDVIVGSTDGI